MLARTCSPCETSEFKKWRRKPNNVINCLVCRIFAIVTQKAMG